MLCNRQASTTGLETQEAGMPGIAVESVLDQQLLAAKGLTARCIKVPTAINMT